LEVCSSGEDEQSCDASDECVTNLVCIENICSEKLADDESCDENKDHCESGFCILKDCSSGLDGQGCTAVNECGADLICLESTCSAKLADGDPCGDNNDCESGSCILEVCLSREDEQSCDASDECVADLVCIENICSAKLVDGNLCGENNNHYESGFCILEVCLSGLDGRSCTVGNECGANLICIDNSCSAKLADGDPCS